MTENSATQKSPSSKIQRRSNSTSHLFISATLDRPKVELMIKAVASLLQSQLISDLSEKKDKKNSGDLYYFSEDKYVEENKEYFDEERKKNIKKIPSLEDIFQFINSLYNCLNFPSECCVISLIYINRVISLTDMALKPTNWRPLVLVSLMISQKIWDDQWIPNENFSKVYPFFDNKQLNILEMKFLEMIQYNVFVKLSVYMKFAVELYVLIHDEYIQTPITKYDFLEIYKRNKKNNKKKRDLSFGKHLVSGQYSNYVIS